MKVAHSRSTDPVKVSLPEETATQFHIKTFHIVISFGLLLGWIWAGSLIFG
jgi:hypothetical protein